MTHYPRISEFDLLERPMGAITLAAATHAQEIITYLWYLVRRVV